MPNALTATGLTTATQTELVTFISGALQTIYGNDINLDSDSPDAQQMMIYIQVTLDNLDLLTQIYNGFDPDLAIGTTLDQRVAINGIVRKGGTYSQTSITVITGTATLLLQGLDLYPSNPYTVADSQGNQWQLLTTVTTGAAGSYSYVFQAQNPGAQLTTVNTITVPVTVVVGVTSVNNPSAQSVIGLNEETDAALRIRRQRSVGLPSQGFLQGLRAALLNINGVTDAFIYENDTGTTDASGVPGHSIWVIVAGTPAIPSEPAYNAATTYAYGDLVSSGGLAYISWKDNNVGNPVTDAASWGVYNPIAEAIYIKRNAGAGMYGAQTYNVVQIDASNFPIYWDNVTPVALFIKFSAVSLDGVNSPNIPLIMQQLPSVFVPSVYGQVNINTLSTAIQSIDPNTLVTNAGFSLTLAGAYTPTLLPVSKKNQFIVSVPNTHTVYIVPYNISIAVSTTTTFVASYGDAPYTWALVSGGGSINASTGVYTAPGIAGSAVVSATDALGNVGYANVVYT